MIPLCVPCHFVIYLSVMLKIQFDEPRIKNKQLIFKTVVFIRFPLICVANDLPWSSYCGSDLFLGKFSAHKEGTRRIKKSNLIGGQRDESSVKLTIDLADLGCPSLDSVISPDNLLYIYCCCYG